MIKLKETVAVEECDQLFQMALIQKKFRLWANELLFKPQGNVLAVASLLQTVQRKNDH